MDDDILVSWPTGMTSVSESVATSDEPLRLFASRDDVWNSEEDCELGDWTNDPSSSTQSTRFDPRHT
jgi:hypothetical protein